MARRIARSVMAPTESAYGYLRSAYDYFNTELWDGKLPGCLITLTNKKGAMGYFSPNRFGRLDKECKNAVADTDEIALNPAHFMGHPLQEAMQTLVHEMCHLWQQRFGEPPRRCYHDKQWANEMKRVGLMPSTTGKPGGKTTGQKMADYVIDGGAFDIAFQRFQRKHDHALYADLRVSLRESAEGSSEKPKSKVKFTCSDCGQNAWGKPDLKIICGGCNKKMESEDS